MKQFLLNLSNRVDALTLRERAIGFAVAAASIVFLVYFSLLDPLFRKQASLQSQISQNRNNIAGIESDITQKVQAYGLDPDAPNRARLEEVKARIEQLGSNLRTMQKGLVTPEKIALVIESILKGNARLRLVSLKTLPPSPMSDGAFLTAEAAPAKPGPEAAAAKLGQDALAAAASAQMPKDAQAKPHAARKAAPAPRSAELVYRHGVQIAVHGNYLDMVDYMGALEAMPTQLFWGKAALEVEEYPDARLTLTLYTLSLDQKWMKL